MNRLFLLTIWLSIIIGCKDETPPGHSGPWDHRALSRANGTSYDWYIGRVDSTMYDIAVDSVTVHSGKWSAHVFSVADSPSSIGHVSKSLAQELVMGKRVRLTSWTRSEIATGSGYFYLRMAKEPSGEHEKSLGKKIYEGIAETVGIGNDKLPEWIFFNEEKPLKTDTGWIKQEFTFDVPQKTAAIWFGAILNGKGKIWIDDISYEIIGKIPVDSSYKDISSYFAKPKDLNFE